MTVENEPIPPLCRSMRTRTQPIRLTYAQEQVLKEEQEVMETMYFQAASTDPDNMYLHEARKEEDWPKLKQAIQEEIDGQINNKNFRVIPRSSLPEGNKVLPGVWVL